MWKIGLLKKLKKMIIQQNILLLFCLFISVIIPQGKATSWPPMHHTSPNPCQVGLSSFNMQICFFITRKPFTNWLYVDDNFWVWVTKFRYWWHLPDVYALNLCWKLEDVGNERVKPSPTSQSCFPRILSSTLVTNIDVAWHTFSL